jgi:hypothetical protein
MRERDEQDHSERVMKFCDTLITAVKSLVKEECQSQDKPPQSSLGMGVCVATILSAAHTMTLLIGKCQKGAKCSSKECCEEPANRCTAESLRFALLLAAHAISDVFHDDKRGQGLGIESSSRTIGEALTSYTTLFPDSPPEKYIDETFLEAAKDGQKQGNEVATLVHSLLAKAAQEHRRNQS